MSYTDLVSSFVAKLAFPVQSVPRCGCAQCISGGSVLSSTHLPKREDIMVQDPQNEAAGEDQWMVAIAPGNVQMMDVEQLDAAYQAGQINDHTMVWTQGMDAWLPLSQVIGGDSAEAAEPVAAPAPVAHRPAPTPAAVTQQLGVQAEVQHQVDATQRAWQEQADAAAAAAFAAAQQAPQIAVPQVLAPSAFAPAAVVQPVAARPAQPAFGGAFAPAQQFAQPAFAQPVIAAAQPAFAPAQQFAQPAFGQGFAQAAAFPSVAAPAAAPGPSTAPMALNLDSLDLGSLDMPKKKSKLGLLAAAALVLGAGGITALNLGGGTSEKAPNAVAAAAAAGAAAGGEAAAAAIAKKDPNAPLDMGGGSYEVTDAEKKAFAKEAEQQQEMRDKMAAALTGPNGEKADTSGKAAAPSAAAAKGAMKAKFGGGGGGGGGKKAKGGGSGLSKGGSSFDPLNGDL